MIEVNIDVLLPRFIMRDKNGYAMARAIEKALKTMCADIKKGVEIVLDVEKMPEWRLDEMAWEIGALYDFSADIEQKRSWIRDSVPLFAAYGTPQAIYNYLEGVFDSVLVQENWQYGGEPFNFRVIVGGNYTAENEAWAMNAIKQTKNARSVLEGLIFVGGIDSGIIIEHSNVGADIPYPLCGAAECGAEMYLT